eukprot:CAMPEP_0174257214 /NCGR_PEP_ID=MMETSP0439-20130205/6389_1 /TAXON_ID=0 /ORGANISM="Stereomyxa ramosa, Strain Chinc5" /LENGTH=346 /DNA_ID=CAMNT_0015340207 /DNA_START=524 /DNA_END=1564 /DNA_ORIENTATION=-
MEEEAELKRRKISNEQMRAVLVPEPGDASKLIIGDCDRPSFDQDELLVQVKAIGINRADTLQREGRYPPPKGASPIIGLELAGVVHSVGQKAAEHGWAPGDRVCALVSGGAYAEYATVHHQIALRIPDNIDFTVAAGIPEAFLTAWQALSLIAGLSDNKSVLIHAGASGVGTSAIQIVKQFSNTKIIITAGTDNKIQFCKELGAHHGFNRKDGPWLDSVLEVTGGEGVDIIIDFVGAGYWEQNISALKVDGHMVMLAFLGGTEISSFNLAPILRKRLNIHGSTLRARSVEYKINLTQNFWEFAKSKFENGEMKPIIDQVFDFTEVAEAHRHMEANKNTGKIILKIE